jgi:hypothetical protein
MRGGTTATETELRPETAAAPPPLSPPSPPSPPVCEVLGDHGRKKLRSCRTPLSLAIS